MTRELCREFSGGHLDTTRGIKYVQKTFAAVLRPMPYPSQSGRFSDGDEKQETAVCRNVRAHKGSLGGQN